MDKTVNKLLRRSVANLPQVGAVEAMLKILLIMGNTYQQAVSTCRN